jgi:hypothetical protein
MIGGMIGVMDSRHLYGMNEFSGNHDPRKGISWRLSHP